jgi:6-pyruvoyltetrahydropterin/6-carboxytetrahydropterin synthase
LFIELDGWMGKLRFSACHLIPNHPKCGRLHGHTYAVSVKVEGEQSGEFIVDFEDLKRIVSDLCDTLDHRILIAAKDARLQILEKEEIIEIIVHPSKKRYVFPREDVMLLPIPSISAEDLCQYISSTISTQLEHRDNIKSLTVRVDEGIGQGAGCTLNLKENKKYKFE